MDGQNIVTYEFQGNLLPLEKAFAQVGKLFRRYIREAKAASADGKLNPDEQFAAKELKNYLKQLKIFRDKVKEGGTLSEDEVEQTRRIFKKILVLTKRFKESRDKILNAKKREERKEEKKQQEVKDYSSISAQFKAQTQADQLALLMSDLPRLDPNVIADINSYVEAWRQAKAAFDAGEISATELATATEELDEKAREYIPTLKSMIHNQKGAISIMEKATSRIITTITSFEFWIRTIKEGTVLLGDYIESLNFLNVSIGNIAWDDLIKGTNEAIDAINNFKDALEDARWSLGLNATDTTTAAATFTAYANAANIASKDVLNFSQNMTQLSIDMASLYNKDTSTMMTALRSALAGNTRAMMNYGISVHDATLNEWLLEKGINRQMSSMSEASQVLVRYAYLMEKTGAAQGDMARTLESPSNQMRVLKAQVQLLTQNLGALFNTVIYPAIRILNMFLIPLNAFIAALTSISTSNYSSSIGGMSDSMDDLADSIDSVSDAAVGLTNLDEINTATQGNGSKTGIDSMIQSLVDGISVYDNFLGKTSKLTTLMKSLGEVLAPIWAMLTNSIVLDSISKALELIGAALKPIQIILDAIKSGYAAMPNWLQKVLGLFGGIAGTIVGIGTALIFASTAMAVFQALAKNSIWQNFTASLTTMWHAFLHLGEVLYAAIAKMITWIATTIKARIEAIKTSIATNGLAKTLGTLIKNLALAAIHLLKYIANLIKAGVVAVATGIKNLFLSKSLWGVALGTIAAAGLGALAVAGVIGAAVAIGKGIQNASQNNTAVPELANGGIATGPTFALIGEGQYNEAVIPLGNSPQMKELQQGVAQEVVRSTNMSNDILGGNATVQLNIDGRALGRASINNIGRVRRQVGVDIK